MVRVVSPTNKGVVRVATPFFWRKLWTGQGGQGGQGTQKSLGAGYRPSGVATVFSQPDFYIYPDHPDHPDQSSIYAGFRESSALTKTDVALTTLTSW